MDTASNELNGIAAPHFAFYENLYIKAGPNAAGEVDAMAAAQFLKTSSIDVVHLSRIWELADYRRMGSLDKRGFFIAFKLIAGVQQGQPVHPSVISLPGLAAPRFPQFGSPSPANLQRHASLAQASPIAGYSPAARSGSVVAGMGNYSRSPSISSASGAEWEIDPPEQQKYDAIFNGLSPLNGKVTGEQCRPVLLNSKLPQMQLAKIWELADIDRDGQLDRYEFCTAMHLVYRCLQNEHLPERLPPSLIHPLKRAAAIQPPARRMSGAMSGGGPSPAHRMPFSMSSRASSVVSLNNAVDGEFHSIFNLSIADGAPWPLDVEKHRATFTQLDTDSDGLVSGVDVRPLLLTFQLPQAILAHIWQLVDLARSGKINLEQFSLVMALVDECQHRVRIPDSLPTHLIPPSLRQRTPSVTEVQSPLGTKLSDSSGALANNTAMLPPQQPPNPRITELNDEIESLLKTRRKAEQDLFQLEADTTVKNSEIKNLEIELLTLTATVKQLQNQKGEANKRLDELDDKVAKLESSCAEQTERLASEGERLTKVKTEIVQSDENSTAEEEVLQSLKSETARVEDEHGSVGRQLTSGSGRMEKLVDELTKMERPTDSDEKEITRIEKLTKDLGETLERMREESVTDEELLKLDFHRMSLNDPNTSPLSPDRALNSQKGFGTFEDAADPFKGDPFAGADDAFGTDPFASAVKSVVSGDGGSSAADPFGPNGFGNGGSKGGGEFADFTQFSSNFS